MGVALSYFLLHEEKYLKGSILIITMDEQLLCLVYRISIQNQEYSK